MEDISTKAVLIGGGRGVGDSGNVHREVSCGLGWKAGD